MLRLKLRKLRHSVDAAVDGPSIPVAATSVSSMLLSDFEGTRARHVRWLCLNIDGYGSVHYTRQPSLKAT